ncbi:MAG: isoprenylcysteine carboxylmethyltransferase family protein [Pyrinomonadaceae bacterium]
MNNISFYATMTSFTIVILVWFIFAGTFWFGFAKNLLARKDVSAVREKTRSNNSFVGIAFQGLSFGLVWGLHRDPFLSPFIDEQYFLNVVLQILAIALVVFSIWLARSAINELGKQWSFAARLIEDHKLITSGVYRIVRNPIYTAMFGMLLATGIAFSHWIVLLIAVVVFLIGARIRITAEEKLLRAAFPAEYDEFAGRVPALIPFVKIF